MQQFFGAETIGHTRWPVKSDADHLIMCKKSSIESCSNNKSEAPKQTTNSAEHHFSEQGTVNIPRVHLLQNQVQCLRRVPSSAQEADAQESSYDGRPVASITKLYRLVTQERNENFGCITPHAQSMAATCCICEVRSDVAFVHD